MKWRDRGTSRMAKRKAPEQHQSEAWNELPWRKLEKHVYRIQTRIYRAKQAGKTRAVHKLEKLLIKSEAARLLAVRRVTQDNQGKRAAGVDGVKSLKPAHRLTMAEMIHPKYNRWYKPKPARRVWIPRPGKDEKRPLGIPRCKGKCLYCGLDLRDGDILEADHHIPLYLGGKETLDNKDILHRHCHDQRHAEFEQPRRKAKQNKQACRAPKHASQPTHSPPKHRTLSLP